MRGGTDKRYLVAERKNAKKSELLKQCHWGGKESLEATKMINQKNEDTLHGMVSTYSADDR